MVWLALVRTLADVFTDQEWMVEKYATYVSHFERALQDIGQSLEMVDPALSTKYAKHQNKDVLKRQKVLAKAIMVRPNVGPAVRADTVI